ncbi:MAG: exodeoxyribonuclease VII large subunit [Bdellovibrionota bacterium]
MGSSDSGSLKGLHPRLRERLDASKGEAKTDTSQMGLFGGAAPGETPEIAEETPKPSFRDQILLDPSPKAEKKTEKKAEKKTEKAITEGRQIYSVTELCSEIKDTLRRGLGTVTVQGEIADFKGVHRNGHLYCALKDETSQLRVVMWKNALAALPFEVKGGLEVIVTGKLDFYAGSGSLQINVERMEPVGIGALQLKFEQLKEKLQKEGLFDVARKRKISNLNWRVGLVTGKSTAALKDMLHGFEDRFPLAEIFFFQATVQGEKAPAEIISAIDLANRWSAESAKPLDVLIVGRGGGSYEDLFCFNDEGVARAMVASKIPVVSAIGHEIDFTIADFVSDKRAATPTKAAEICTPDQRDWLRRLNEIEEQLPLTIEDMIRERQEKIDTLTNRLVLAAPHKKLQHQKELLKHREEILVRSLRKKLEALHATLERKGAVLDALSPLKVLDRGYSVARDTSGKALRSVAQVKVGETVELQLADGQIQATVAKVSRS